MEQGRRGSARDKDLEEGEEGIESMSGNLQLGLVCIAKRGEYGKGSYVRPGIKDNGKPRVRIQDGPVHDGHQERKRHYSGIEDRIRRLQRPWPALQPGLARSRVPERVQRAEEHIEG